MSAYDNLLFQALEEFGLRMAANEKTLIDALRDAELTLAAAQRKLPDSKEYDNIAQRIATQRGKITELIELCDDDQLTESLAVELSSKQPVPRVESTHTIN